MELGNISEERRLAMAKKFTEEVILEQWKQLQDWNKLTNQTSQIDFGYLAQHLVSIVTGLKGEDTRGKGYDLERGSEVKSASCLDAVDTPRWNGVNCGAKTEEELIEKYRDIPHLFFVLIDTTKRAGSILRVRIWAVRPNEDENFRKVALSWPNGKRTNLQLHPPRWEKADENITTNTCGNLKLPLIYHSEQIDVPGVEVMEIKYHDLSKIYNGVCEYIRRD